MTDTPYTGQADDRRYSGEQADITYSLKRCIHAEECIHRLSAVFDPKKRPWIQADGASADDLVAMVTHCPSGALHVERKDGGVPEAPPRRKHDHPVERRSPATGRRPQPVRGAGRY